MDGAGNGWERELSYYRRECNDLGARLLRLQEEQSQAFREARRSRTVVKLLRETYRLGDFASTTHDVGGSMLELVVDHTLCDRAALLREEKPESGRFLVAHAIGLPESALTSVIDIMQPPEFLFTSGQTSSSRAAEQVVAAMGVPHVLWAYDRGSGHALVIGNRSESNVSRPFELGDQELIESALSIYLDVLYRKHAEAQLRQAKQAAEAARDARVAFLNELAGEVRDSIATLIELCERTPGQAGLAQSSLGQNGADRVPASVQRDAQDVVQLARYVQSLVDEASWRETGPEPVVVLEPEWIAVDELIRGALRTAYTASIKSGVEIECRLPNRRCAIMVDRLRMGYVLQQLVASAVRATPSGGTVRVASSRRSDGGLEIFLTCRGAGPLAVAHPRPETSMDMGGWHDGIGVDMARRTVEAHQGTLNIESSAFAGTNVRLILPAQHSRDVDIAGVDEA